MSNDIKSKIRKLFELARNNSNENEAAAALQKAQRMMLEHGIDSINDEDGPTQSGPGLLSAVWHTRCVQAACRLYGTVPVFNAKNTFQYIIVGRANHIDASAITVEFLLYQVEELYKSFMPKGMDKKSRASFRRDFKNACSQRLLIRAVELTEDTTEVVSQSGTALTVRHRVEQLSSEAMDYLKKNKNVEVTKWRSRYQPRDTDGTVAGINAGNAIDLQRSLKS